MFKAGFARKIITPVMGIPLCGYFSPRPNAGVIDDLLVRLFLKVRQEYGLRYQLPKMVLR